MPLAEFVHDALQPLRGPPLWLVGVASPLLALAGLATVMDVPTLLLLGSSMWLALGSCLWTYGFLLIEAAAHGLPSPLLTAENINPWHEPRPLLPLLALAALWGAALAAGGPAVAALIPFAVILAALVMPACLALLAVEGSVARAFWPPALLRVAVALGPRYLAVCALGAGYAMLLWFVAGRLPALVVAALGQLALYSVAGALGASLYRRREILGLDAWQSPERTQARAAAVAGKEQDALAATIYGLLRVHRASNAWQLAQQWLDGRDHDPAACRWLRDRALLWKEMRFADRLDAALIARLVALGRLGEAVATLEACWNRGGTLPLLAPGDGEALHAAAARQGHPATVDRLRQEHPPA